MSNTIIKAFGIGNKRATHLNRKVGINLRKGLAINLSKKHIANLENAKIIYNYKTNDVLKDTLNKIHMYLSTELKSRKGLRNKHGLPARGQRTKTNAKTKRKLRNKLF